MPSTSRSQQKFFQACEHDPKHMNGKCPDMPKAKMHSFASGSMKGKPEHAKGKKSARKKRPPYFGGK